MSSEAQTKFFSLSIGQRFSWRGNWFVKTSPLLACAEDSGQSQMIPRSALVGLAPGTSVASTSGAADAAQRALELLQRAALAGVEELGAEATPQTTARVRGDVQAAYRRALKLLEGKDG
ncbi:MAG TPA: hypothetical protein VIR60_03920 [Gammaproteobacteria bacterium]